MPSSSRRKLCVYPPPPTERREVINVGAIVICRAKKECLRWRKGRIIKQTAPTKRAAQAGRGLTYEHPVCRVTEQ